jgi:hypothetical protein
VATHRCEEGEARYGEVYKRPATQGKVREEAKTCPPAETTDRLIAKRG